MPFAYSIDRKDTHGFVGDFETTNEAIVHAIIAHDLFVGQTVYIGRDQRPPISNFVPSIIESMRDIAFEDFGDAAKDWPNPTHEHALKLQNDIELLVARWCEETENTIQFYKVVDVKEFSIRTRHMMKAYEILLPKEGEAKHHD